jgi:hypothetical protein
VKERFFRSLLAVLASLVVVQGSAQAGGPIVVTANGRPYRYDAARPVRYAVDGGPLGSRSHAEAVALAEQAFRTWAGVPTAQLRFEAAGELAQDIGGRDLLPFLDGLKAGDPGPILFDNDGSITDLLFGQGSSQDRAGFSVPERGDPATGHLLVSVAFLNGVFLSRYSDSAALEWFIHELGHFVGLGHSQLGAAAFYDGDPTNDHLAPAMSYSFGPNSQAHLHREDEAWFSWLYPDPDFAARTGSIRGRVLLPDRATGLEGVSVIARRVGDPEVTAVSGVSGFLFGGLDDALRDPGRVGVFWPARGGRSGGVSDPARLGEFLIPGLPPGAYTLELAPVEDEPGVSDQGYLVGGPKFWREGSSSQDPPSASTPIQVSAGKEVGDVDIVVNGQDLGQPRVRIEEEPNPWVSAQDVGALPVEILGAVQGDRGVSTVLTTESALSDAYLVKLTEWTTVTAILSSEQPATDLDLHVYGLAGSWIIVDKEIAPGTPPETVQLRLPPGEYRFGVHHSGGPGSAYTLRLLATPAPAPADSREPARVNYLVVGEVTPTSAVIRWQTTDEAASVVRYGQPLREIGDTRRSRDHTIDLTGLTPASLVSASVHTAPNAGFIIVDFTTAKPPAANGAPRIGVKTSARLNQFRPLGLDSSVATVLLPNTGDGDALNVRVEEVTVPPGWEVLSTALSGTGLPPTLEVGRIGAGGEGVIRVWLVRRSGSADPGLVVHGSYTDAAGTLHTF